MSVTHVWRNTISVPGLPQLPADDPLTIPGNNAIDVEVSVPASTTTEVDVGTIDKTKIQSLVINSTLNATLKTNAADATGGQTISLTAKKSFSWNIQQDQSSFPNPISQSISKFFVTNPSPTVALTFRAGFLLLS